ncbi:nicotinamide-nucleotide amidohydrolase PncC [Arenicella chitinivorans]|uniref:CinA-like protein n=1 Tax=Arenicella chitinivorans TaxID=1329800 RepID=A0A918RTE8_9GAMM|nr:CinA family nicotinamide mononucleotide deamidase-related protein [Arenicella chitinivorans]GHA08684.1 nicotinamide-nucleotide amidohydrolase PncC [Arenicella chitinivorans]
MKISLLLTGNELMTGDTIDSNSAYLAQSLKDLTLVPYIKKVVGDDLSLLVSSIKELAAVSDVLIVNGGLGPTVDDLTAKALSLAIDSPLQQNPQAMAKLEAWAERRGFVITKSNLKQTELPALCKVIENPRGSAVGFHCVHEGCLIICTPGVPGEFKHMVEASVLPLIRAHGHLDVVSEITRIRIFGITESGLQDMVDAEFPDWPAEVELGFRVQMPVIEVKLATIGEQARGLNALWTEKFCTRFSDYIIGRDSTRLTEALNTALYNQGLTLTTAESCTGGLIAAGITSEAGASRVFEAGYVVYSNKIKQHTLGVSEASLMSFGAVSEVVVREMAEGALNKSGADMALAISGIAGPDGGTEDKPVGTVWMAWGRKGAISARRFFFPVPRLAFQKTATAIAMDLVRREVLGLPTNVDYFSELKKKRA